MRPVGTSAWRRWYRCSTASHLHPPRTQRRRRRSGGSSTAPMRSASASRRIRRRRRPSSDVKTPAGQPASRCYHRSPMRAADALMESLKAEGVQHVFGIPGGANLPTYDAMVDADFDHIQVRHEQGGGHAAEGYAQASGRVGGAFAPSGPGATNLATAIADAMMDSVPTVFVTGQVRTELIGTDGFQEADILGATLPFVKH